MLFRSKTSDNTGQSASEIASESKATPENMTSTPINSPPMDDEVDESDSLEFSFDDEQDFEENSEEDQSNSNSDEEQNKKESDE